MKQRVIVQGIIRKGDKVLLLRRSQGRPDLVGVYELPGGRVETNEQPDDAVRRHLYTEAGLDVRSVELVDAIATTNVEEGNAQNIILVYDISLQRADQPIKIGQHYNSYIWQSMHSLQQLNLRDSSRMVLEGSPQPTSTDSPEHEVSNTAAVNTTDITHVTIYSDGGSRGNPGPSSAGYVIFNHKDELIDKGGLYLGITTNNQAEYQGVRIGLEQALELGARSVEFRVDSLLVVNQMRGVYKIKNRELWPINERIRGLIEKFDKVSFVHVPREENQLADAMVNSILDKHQAKIL